MKKIISIALVAAALSACAAPVANYKPPVIDEGKFSEAQKVSFKGDLDSCQLLANKSITEFEENAAMYSPNEQTRVTEKRRAVRRVCLQGRGYSVLY
jgi:hypothetical protein